MEDKLKDKSLEVRKTPTEADYLYPSGFNVGFHASCYITVRVGAFTKKEAVGKVQAMLADWDKRYDKESERILGVPSLEDSPAVTIEMQHITKQERKWLSANRNYLPNDVIRDWLIDPDEFPEDELTGAAETEVER